MPKNVQIPMDLFLSLVRYHYLQDPSPELPGEILKGLEDKLEAIIKHNLYSVYHNPALSDADRERARQEYLDRIGLRKDFRWPEGWTPGDPPDK